MAGTSWIYHEMAEFYICTHIIIFKLITRQTSSSPLGVVFYYFFIILTTRQVRLFVCEVVVYSMNKTALFWYLKQVQITLKYIAINNKSILLFNRSHSEELCCLQTTHSYVTGN